MSQTTIMRVVQCQQSWVKLKGGVLSKANEEDPPLQETFEFGLAGRVGVCGAIDIGIRKGGTATHFNVSLGIYCIS